MTIQLILGAVVEGVPFFGIRFLVLFAWQTWPKYLLPLSTCSFDTTPIKNQAFSVSNSNYWFNSSVFVFNFPRMPDQYLQLKEGLDWPFATPVLSEVWCLRLSLGWFPAWLSLFDQESDDLGYGHDIHVRKSGRYRFDSPFLPCRSLCKTSQNDKLG